MGGKGSGMHGNGGRPKGTVIPSELRKDARVSFRLTPEQHAAIAQAASAVGLSVGEFARRAALESATPPDAPA